MAFSDDLLARNDGFKMTILVVQSLAYRQQASHPLLTIGIPTWNRAGRLERQLQLIDPILTSAIEFVVCDNGSDDDTWKLLEAFCNKTANSVAAVRNGINIGADANYLRIIEAASGDWIWLIGDDEDIDFGTVVRELLKALISVRSCVLMLLDHSELQSVPTTPTALSFKEFLKPKYDLLGKHIHQVGRVVCRGDAAKLQLRSAYALSHGLLHSYAPVYAALLQQGGLALMKFNLHLAESSGTVQSRWDALRGLIGAWKMSVISHPNEPKLVGAREIRLRQKPLLAAVSGRLVTETTIDGADIRWMLKVFDMSGKMSLLLLLAAFFGSRRLALAYLGKWHPNIVAAIRDQSRPVDSSY